MALTGAVACWALAVVAAGLARSLWLAVVLLAVAGAADLVSVVYRQTILQTYAPDEMRGRMQGVFTVVVTGGPRLGDLRAGVMAAATGLTIAWSGSAALCFAVVVILSVSVRSFWHYQSPVTSDSDSGPEDSAGPGEGAGEESQAGAEDSRRAS
jgi:MFS family permease